MGNKATLRVDRQSLEIENQMPYTWSMLFDEKSSGHKFTVSTKAVRRKFEKIGLSVDPIEAEISEVTGWEIEYWKGNGGSTTTTYVRYWER